MDPVEVSKPEILNPQTHNPNRSRRGTLTGTVSVASPLRSRGGVALVCHNGSQTLTRLFLFRDSRVFRVQGFSGATTSGQKLEGPSTLAPKKGVFFFCILVGLYKPQKG